MPSADLQSRARYAMGTRSAGNELLDLLGSPFTYGEHFYVDADNGGDNNAGDSSDNAKLTIDGTTGGYSLLTAGNHDVLHLSANGGHTLSDEFAFDKDYSHIVGGGFRGGAHMGQRSRISLPAGVSSSGALAAVLITAKGGTLNDLKISSADTLSTSLFGVVDAGEFTIMRGVWVEKSTDLDQTGAAELAAIGDTCSYIGCTFGNMIYRPSVARQNVLFTRETIVTGKVCRAAEFLDCYFLGFPSATTFSHLRATISDIERFVILEKCKLLSKVGGSIADEAITIGSALTDGGIFLNDCLTNATNTATVSSGVFTSAAASHEDGSKVTEVS